MKVVIDIPEDDYRFYEKFHKENYYPKSIFSRAYSAIANGTPLPKGHGRLIDADKLTKEIKSYISDTSNLHYDDLVEAESYNSAYSNCLDEIEDAPTIIEADKENADGKDDWNPR